MSPRIVLPGPSPFRPSDRGAADGGEPASQQDRRQGGEQAGEPGHAESLAVLGPSLTILALLVVAAELILTRVAPVTRQAYLVP